MEAVGVLAVLLSFQQDWECCGLTWQLAAKPWATVRSPLPLDEQRMGRRNGQKVKLGLRERHFNMTTKEILILILLIIILILIMNMQNN